jgi:dTDP-4-dehydrorhamnose reductase
MTKRILITGANGQLGKSFKEIAKTSNHFFLFTDIDELDITDFNQVDIFFRGNKPDFLINCAAYTAVDRAETDEKMAFLLNRDAVKNLAEACKIHNCVFIHISTDYVFDGEKTSPYNESDKVNPQSVYGKSKLAGEEILQNYDNAIIIRTSWLYSDFGNNFLATMQRLGREKDEIRVVNDQFGCPTYATDLAKTIIIILEKTTNLDKKTQIFHFSNEGRCSWFDFASEIMKLSQIDCLVSPISTSEYPTVATRPLFSVLDKTKIKETFNIHIRTWQEALVEAIISKNLNH